MLPDTGEGPRVPAAEQRLDAADEPCLLLQAPPGDDEGPVVRQGLLFELLQSIRSEVDARGLKEGVGSASHVPILQLRATPGDRTSTLRRSFSSLPAVGTEVLIEEDETWVLLSQGGDVGLVAVIFEPPVHDGLRLELGQGRHSNLYNRLHHKNGR